MPEDLQEILAAFTKDKKFNRKGPLCVALVMTQQARTAGLPLDSGQLLTEGGGQVLGLGKGAVQSILARHGITRVLASEGGRHLLEIWRYSRPRFSEDRTGFLFEMAIADLRQQWVIINCAYILFLLLYHYTTVMSLRSDLFQFTMYPYVYLICCVASLIYDIAISEPFTKIIKRT
jgi:Domain of unknown function (DUF4928)